MTVHTQGDRTEDLWRHAVLRCQGQGRFGPPVHDPSDTVVELQSLAWMWIGDGQREVVHLSLMRVRRQLFRVADKDHLHPALGPEQLQQLQGVDLRNFIDDDSAHRPILVLLPEPTEGAVGDDW